MQKVKYVSCPQCGEPSPFTPENRFRPFCSERCKMIDLGRWAAEDYRIPDSLDPQSSTSESDNTSE